MPRFAFVLKQFRLEDEGLKPRRGQSTIAEFTITDTPGYSQVYAAIDDFAHSTPQPRLAAAAMLNAVCAVALTTMDGDMLADILRQTAARIPAEQAKARDSLN